MKLWNSEDNQINAYSRNELVLGNILIFTSLDKKSIVIEGFESDDQENCLKLRILKIESSEIKLEQAH